MFDLLNEFIPTLSTTVVNLIELGLITGVGIAFFKGLSWIVNSVKSLVASEK